ncbi:hypothetical protein PBF_05788 [Cytobacillus firmus DS1]|uniref:Uncharacterized protein n=1 Tax=Cytobacillus firmus DS1 TaxID=1307436 RepID=W7LAS1_CYTFI|nr:hypothetical protein PBF_05788 [Cytobacillus firmus DS1]
MGTKTAAAGELEDRYPHRQGRHPGGQVITPRPAERHRQQDADRSDNRCSCINPPPAGTSSKTFPLNPPLFLSTLNSPYTKLPWTSPLSCQPK